MKDQEKLDEEGAGEAKEGRRKEKLEGVTKTPAGENALRRNRRFVNERRHERSKRKMRSKKDRTARTAFRQNITSGSFRAAGR